MPILIEGSDFFGAGSMLLSIKSWPVKTFLGSRSPTVAEIRASKEFPNNCYMGPPGYDFG